MEFFTSNMIIQIIGYLFGAGGVIFSLIERRKNKAITTGVEADVESKGIKNSQQVVTLYKDALDDLSNRYQKKYEEITSLYERKIQVLEAEIKVHKRYVNTLKKEITDLRKQIKILEAKI